MAGKGKTGGSLATNRRALHDYEVLSRHEVGVALVGTEVKVARGGGVSLAGAYVEVENGELWLSQASFPPYSHGNRFNHDPGRRRRLLAHKREIRWFQAQRERKGLTLIPLRLYVLARNGRVKLELGVCRGKRLADKRETVKEREAQREARRAIAQAGR